VIKPTVIKAIFALGLTLVMGSSALALDGTSVLPSGIRSPAVRFGIVGNIDQRYTSSGSLQTLSDFHSIQFDAATLRQVEPRAQQLISVLNQFGHQNLGDALSLGVLRIETKPEVSYLAPIYAYGMTSRLTLAFGLPVITYRNRLSLSQSGSNVAAIQAEVGRSIPELSAAFDQLNTSLVSSVQRELAQKGYRSLSDREQTIAGDLQLAAIYRFFESPRWTAASKTYLTLPTGPKEDPDDLAQLSIFGETSLEEAVVLNYQPFARTRMAAKMAYRWTVPDKITKRVPESSSDSLPSADRKENLRRDLGDVITIGASAAYQVLSRWSLAGGYELMSRYADQYRGSRGWNYSLLESETAGYAVRTRAALEYSSTDAYLAKQALLPMLFAYEFMDTIAGQNIERQTRHEISLTLFF